MDWVGQSCPQQSSAVKLWLRFRRYLRSFTALCFQEAKGPALKDFACNILLPCGVRTPLKGVKSSGIWQIQSLSLVWLKSISKSLKSEYIIQTLKQLCPMIYQIMTPKVFFSHIFYTALNGTCVMRTVKWIFPQNEIWQKLHSETTYGAVTHLLPTS